MAPYWTTSQLRGSRLFPRRWIYDRDLSTSSCSWIAQLRPRQRKSSLDWFWKVSLRSCLQWIHRFSTLRSLSMSGKATQRSELRMPSLKVHPHFGALLGCSAEAQKNWQAQSLVLKSSLEPDQGFLSLLQAGCSVPWLKAMWMVSGRLSPSASRQHRQLSLLKISRSFHSCVWLTLVLRSSRSIFTTDSCLHRTLCSLILREGANQSLNRR